jgi:hypothetical protein
MNRIKILSLASAIFSLTAQADVHVLNDAELAEYAGQAGLTIDTDSNWNNNAFALQDAGSSMTQGIKISGHGSDGSASARFYTNHLDNLKLNIDVAGGGETGEDNRFNYGLSEVRELANVYLQNGNLASTEDFRATASGVDSTRDGLLIDDKKTLEEGDLLIHYGYADAWEKDGGFAAHSAGEGLSGQDLVTVSYDEAEDIMNRSVDFKYSIDTIGIATSGYQLGLSPVGADGHASALSSGSKTTSFMSNLSLQGYLGPHDLHIKNSVNSAGGENPNSGVTWNSYFKVTDLDVYLDISGIQISDVQIHNERGDLSGIDTTGLNNGIGTSSFGFAHAEREIYAVKDAILDLSESKDSVDKRYKDGIAFNTKFKGDIDIHHLSFGDTGISVGEFFITDMYFNSQLTITAR